MFSLEKCFWAKSKKGGDRLRPAPSYEFLEVTVRKRPWEADPLPKQLRETQAAK